MSCLLVFFLHISAALLLLGSYFLLYSLSQVASCFPFIFFHYHVPVVCWFSIFCNVLLAMLFLLSFFSVVMLVWPLPLICIQVFVLQCPHIFFEESLYANLDFFLHLVIVASPLCPQHSKRSWICAWSPGLPPLSAWGFICFSGDVS